MGDVVLIRASRYPNPLVVPQTLGDFKKSGGHPQFPRSFRGRTLRTPPNPLFIKEGEVA